jgi:hypothetical protein
MPQKTRTALLTDITTLLPDNDTGAISEADLRSIATDLADSTRFLGEAPAPHGHDAGEVSGLAPVATSGAYGDLTGQPAIPALPGDIGAAAFVHDHVLADIMDAGSAAASEASAFATAAQGVLAGTALQPGAQIPAGDVTGLGSAAMSDAGDFATSAQGTLAGTAIQPGDAALITSAERTKLGGIAAGAEVNLTGPEIVAAIDAALGHADWRTAGAGGGATAPGQITGLGATSGDGQGALVWTAPADPGSAALTDYIIERRISGGTFAAIAGGGGLATVFTDTGVTNGTTYEYRIAARNGAGLTGPVSATASATPAASTSVPEQVTGLVAAPGDGQIVLNWTVPGTGGSALTDYIIERSIGSGSFAQIADGAGTATTFTDTGLTNGVTHTYRVAAVNGIGTGAFSASAGATPTVSTFQVTGGSGGVTITVGAGAASLDIDVVSPAVYAGSYTIALADLAAGPVNLVPVAAEGVQGAGNQLTVRPGLWIYDGAGGAPLLTYEWQPQAAGAGTVFGSTYTQTAIDATFGVRLIETATTGAGQRTGLIDAVPIPFPARVLLDTTTNLRLDPLENAASRRRVLAFRILPDNAVTANGGQYIFSRFFSFKKIFNGTTVFEFLTPSGGGASTGRGNQGAFVPDGAPLSVIFAMDLDGGLPGADTAQVWMNGSIVASWADTGLSPYQNTQFNFGGVGSSPAVQAELQQWLLYAGNDVPANPALLAAELFDGPNADPELNYRPKDLLPAISGGALNIGGVDFDLFINGFADQWAAGNNLIGTGITVTGTPSDIAS